MSTPSVTVEKLPAAPNATAGTGPRPLYLGFFLFGITLGITTGLSQVSGISQALLSALFTFVGGVLLTYAGFKKKVADDSVLDVARVGHGLSALMTGILLGLYGGIYARLDPPLPRGLKDRLQERQAPSQGTDPEATPAPTSASASPGAGFVLHAESRAACNRIWERILEDSYSASPECSPAVSDLKDLFRANCAAPTGSWESAR